MTEPALSTPASQLDTVVYDNRIVRNFLVATIVWGVVGMLVGVIVAAQMAWPVLNFGLEWLSFGRLRPLHTNAVIFAFTGNAIFAGVYYSSQRLLKSRMWSDALSQINFWGWQLIIVAAAVTLPLGLTTSKEYAELEWPIDIAITLVWVVFGANLIGTLFTRRERHLYVAIWFYLSTFIAVALLHVVNSLEVPYSAFHSYPIYAGMQDALVQWWYGHNAVAFFLTTPILGLMYYFLPKAAGAPIYSYRLSILHFWSLIFIYIWARPHHQLNTSMPEWAQTQGVLFSVMLIAPSWGGAINGFMTIRAGGAKAWESPALPFFVTSLVAYAITTFEGSMLSLRTVNMVSHNTDWTVGHVHDGALGWVGFLVFGMIYFLVPKLWKAPVWSNKLIKVHFWLCLVSLTLYVVAMFVAGIVQAYQQLAFDESGHLLYPNFMQVVASSLPYYHARVLAGVLYLGGVLVMAFNVWKSVQGARCEDEAVLIAPLQPDTAYLPMIEKAATTGTTRDKTSALHGLVERWPTLMTILIAVAVAIGGLVELVPHLVQGAMTPRIATVTPYTPLELAGRDIYIREGCNNCHTQLIRTIRAETERYGDYTRTGEHIYDRPHLWGSKRTGPDLAREGLIKPGAGGAVWHYKHMMNPQDGAYAFTRPDGRTVTSVMPPYPWLATARTDYAILPAKLAVLANAPMYTPYTRQQLDNAIPDAKAQAAAVAAQLRTDPELAQRSDLEDSEMVALIAYLQRLGTDLNKPALPAPALVAAGSTTVAAQ